MTAARNDAHNDAHNHAHTDAATVVYLVAIAPRGSTAAAGTLPEIEPGCPTLALPLNDALECVVTHLPADLLTGPDAEARLADVKWLAPRAAAHEATLHALTAGSSGTLGVLPLRFGSLFSGPEALRRAVAPMAHAAHAFIESTAGLGEYTLRAWYDPAADTTARAHEPPPAATGADYLRRRRELHRAGVRPGGIPPHAAARAQAAADAVAQCAIELKPARTPSAPDDTGRLCAGAWACLLHPTAAAAARLRLAALGGTPAASGLAAELTGPWPLYSFCPPTPGEDTQD